MVCAVVRFLQEYFYVCTWRVLVPNSMLFPVHLPRWLENYHKHPYGWGALIMIHGTDEVCFRLRTKVENYAVYSALFLSASIVLLMSPSETIFDLCPRTKARWPAEDWNDYGHWLCEVQIRLYFYSIGRPSRRRSCLCTFFELRR